MPSPSSSIATLRPELAGSMMEFDLEADRDGYIAQRVAPVIEVAKPSGLFGKIPIEQLLKTRDTARAPGSGYARGSFTFTSQSFACEEHGAEEPVDDREAQMYGDFFDAEVIAAQRARHAVLQNYEERVETLVFNASTWTATTITHEWDDAANAVPISDVETAVQAVYTASGLWPNALIINKKVFRNLKKVDEIQALVSSQSFMDIRPGEIGVKHLEAVFDLMIIVAGGTKDTAVEGQTASPGPLWSDEYAMVARVATTSDPREPCVARTFHYAEDGSEIGGAMESYRDETVRGDVIRARNDVDELVLYTEAAHLLDNVTT